MLSREELVRRREELRLRGESLVLTNGCFDLLHVGHVRYLSMAKALGNALAVAVNSDTSVGRLKGPGRPLVPEEERAEIVAALGCVDFVTIFAEDTASALLDQVRPDMYVKGGDYSPDPSSPRFPPEGHVVLSYGGAVRIIDYVPDHSTTDLVRRLQCLAIAETQRML